MQSPPSSRVNNNNNNNRNVNLGYNVHLQEQRTESYDQSGLVNGPSNGNVDSYDQQPQQQQTSATTSSHTTAKKSLPPNGKKTKGRVKIKMEFIDNKLRRYTTFSKRKTGIMKKAYELSTLTGTQVMLLVASETGHVYTFATRKLQPMITSEAGKALIQTCLNSPDPPPGPGSSSLDQRMSATGFEETDLSYSVGDDLDKVSDNKGAYSSSPSSPQSGEGSPPQVMRSDSPPNFVTLSDVPSSNNQQQAISNNAGFATILAAATPGSSLGQAIQIGGFQTSSDGSASSSQSTNVQPVYRLPTQGSFSVALSNAAKNQSNSTDGTQASAPAGSVSVVQDPQQQNLSLVSGNVVIPASQAILQAAGANSSNASGNGVQGAFMYHTAQGLVYAAPSGLSDRVIINLGQEQSTAASPQYITIPVTLSLTPAQQQLLRVSTTTATDSSQNQGGGPTKKAKK